MRYISTVSLLLAKQYIVIASDSEAISDERNTFLLYWIASSGYALLAMTHAADTPTCYVTSL